MSGFDNPRNLLVLEINRDEQRRANEMPIPVLITVRHETEFLFTPNLRKAAPNNEDLKHADVGIFVDYVRFGMMHEVTQFHQSLEAPFM